MPCLSAGYYIYFESSTGGTGYKAQLSSPSISVPAGHSSCLSLWYHMYGQHVSTLTVYQNTKRLWTRSGDQGNKWLQAQITVNGRVSNQKVYLLAEMSSVTGEPRLWGPRLSCQTWLVVGLWEEWRVLPGPMHRRDDQFHSSRWSTKKILFFFSFLVFPPSV